MAAVITITIRVEEQRRADGGEKLDAQVDIVESPNVTDLEQHFAAAQVGGLLAAARRYSQEKKGSVYREKVEFKRGGER